MGDAWVSAAAYESYVGRWSRLVTADFLDWLADVVVSGLMLNHVADPAAAVAAMRAAVPAGWSPPTSGTTPAGWTS